MVYIHAVVVWCSGGLVQWWPGAVGMVGGNYTLSLTFFSFSPDFELEDITLRPRVPHRLSLEPVFPSSDCALTLYNFTNEL